jgi:Ca2+-binding RTX toxin-like protein
LGVASLSLVPSASALTLRPGDVIVADIFAFGGDGGLIKVNPATGKQTVLSTNGQSANTRTSEFMDDPYDVTVMPDGTVLAAEEYAAGGAASGEGSVVGVNPATGKQRVVSSNEKTVNVGTSEFFIDPWGVVFLPGRGIVVGDYNAFADGGLIGVSPASGKERVLASNDQPVNMGTSELFFNPARLAVARSGELAVVTHGSDPGVVGVNPATGKQRVLSSRSQPVNLGSTEYFDSPEAIDVAADGRLVVVDSGAFTSGGVIGVNPATGKQSKVSANNLPVNSSSMIFQSPEGIATALNGDLIVVEPSAPPTFGGTGGAVIRVDPATGAQTLLSSNDTPVNSGSSELLDEPYGVTVVPPRCSGRFATMYGGPGRETLKGGRFGDVVAALGGKDLVKARKGKDRACGGAGNDRLEGGTSADVLIGGAGRDVCIGGTGNDKARGCEVRRSITR